MDFLQKKLCENALSVSAQWRRRRVRNQKANTRQQYRRLLQLHHGKSSTSRRWATLAADAATGRRRDHARLTAATPACLCPDTMYRATSLPGFDFGDQRDVLKSTSIAFMSQTVTSARATGPESESLRTMERLACSPMASTGFRR